MFFKYRTSPLVKHFYEYNFLLKTNYYSNQPKGSKNLNHNANTFKCVFLFRKYKFLNHLLVRISQGKYSSLNPELKISELFLTKNTRSWNN